MDHLGGPLGVGPYAGHRAEVLEGWRRDIAAAAACPNIVVKVGGFPGQPCMVFEMGMETSIQGFCFAIFREIKGRSGKFKAQSSSTRQRGSGRAAK